MGVDTRLSLPGNVRVKDVASVLGILFGLPSKLEPLSGGDAVWCRVQGANVSGFETIPEMARIDLKQENGDYVAGFCYHFENPGGRRVMSGRATPKVIAAFKRVADFFGGRVDFADYDEEDADHSAPDRSDDENTPEDGAAWDMLQRRMAEVKPLTLGEIKACVRVSAYPERL